MYITLIYLYLYSYLKIIIFKHKLSLGIQMNNNDFHLFILFHKPLSGEGYGFAISYYNYLNV